MSRGKYESLFDTATWDYIDRINELFPPALAIAPLEEQRRVYNEMCRQLQPARPNGVLIEDQSVRLDGRILPVRRYQPSNPVGNSAVLFFHGGGFIFGNLDNHDDVCAHLCAKTGIKIVSVDYRLAPEHLHPAAYEDALAAFHWLAKEGRPIILVGESAGGSLAASVAQTVRSNRALQGVVLIYPTLGGPADTQSRRLHAQAPLLASRDIETYDVLRSDGPPPMHDPIFAPLSDHDFSRLPPTVIVTAQCDPLADDGKIYAQAITKAGGKAHCREESRLPHSFLRARESVTRANIAFDNLADDLVMLSENRWDYSATFAKREAD